MSDPTSIQLPDTGISGVYEVIVGVNDADHFLKYFEQFGFTVTSSAEIDANQSEIIYGHRSALKSYRLQNGDIDSHGLLRILQWEQESGPGVGYMPPRTTGQRISVMRTHDIFRLHDIYTSARQEGGEKWLPTHPVADDLFDLNKGKKNFFNRPVIVRENAVYGEFFNHIFFQRYGYIIPGYGTIGGHAPLKTSEFTHHDFFVSCSDMGDMSYLSSALGLKAEEEPKLDGDWQVGPKEVFMLKEGEAHWYQGFVSPNNICGKLKFFIPTSVNANRTDHQNIGALGITLHSFYTPRIALVHNLVTEHQLNPTAIHKNEFDERSFVFKGPGGCNWQIIEKEMTTHQPVTELTFELTNE